MEQTSNRELSGIVRSLEERVEELIEGHNALSQAYGALKRENEELKGRHRAKEEQIRDLQRDLATAELVGAMVRGADPKGAARAQAYINRLMREVDTCITLLSSPTEEGGEKVIEVAIEERGDE